MKALIQSHQGVLFADFSWDEAPPGLEDCFDESDLYYRLKQNIAYGEFGEPNTDHMTGHPSTVIRRVLDIEHRNVCCLLSALQLPDGVRLFIAPHGILGHKLGDYPNATPHYLKLRTVTQPDEDDNPRVVKIITADIVD